LIKSLDLLTEEEMTDFSPETRAVLELFLGNA
jgi:hypothetical protein